MDNHETHSRHVLAASEVCAVERCEDCGVVHVHFGAVSIRFTPEAYAVLCETLFSARSEAMREIPKLEAQHGKTKCGLH